MYIWKYSDYSRISQEAEDNFVFENPRQDQLETITEIKDAIDKGYKYIILEAGTGTGKSAIAATLTAMFDTSYILTVTKQLQSQYVRDFPDFQLVKGRSNFKCKKYAQDSIDETCDNGRCIVEGYSCEFALKGQKPTHENTCEYYYQKYLALESDVVIANYPYMFLELNYVNDFTGRDILICDEAHNLESTIMNQLKLEFKLTDLKKHLKINLDDETVSKLEGGDYHDWISFIKRIQEKYQIELDKIIDIRGRPELNEKISFMKKQITDCIRFISHIEYDSEIWICDWDDFHKVLEFKPLKIDHYAKKNLLDYGGVCILMSATILDYRLFAKWLGISEESIYPIRKKSPFDVKRNPIKTYDKYNLSKNFIKVNAPKTIDAIKLILEKHKNEKGIIHTVSRQCQNFLMTSIKDERLIDHDAQNREEQLEMYVNSDEPLVLVSPSMNEGVDLPGDLCRFQIMYKIPYPDLGDKQISLRNNIDDKWYDYKTCLSLVQTHGRGMRFEDDYCRTYFIDNRFTGYVKRDLNENGFLPQTFRDAIDTLPAEIEVQSDDYFADESFDEKVERKYRLVMRANQFLDDENYEGAIRFYTSLINHELFVNDYHPYLKLVRAYHESELYENEVKTIIRFFKSGRYCNTNKLKWFKKRLFELCSMGYFDENRIPDLEREFKNNGALNKILSNQPVPIALNIKKDMKSSKPELKYPPEYFDSICRMKKDMTYDEMVAFKYRLCTYGKNLMDEKEHEKAIGFYLRLVDHELFINDYYPYRKLVKVLRRMRKYKWEAEIITQFFKSDRYCDSKQLRWFIKRLEELSNYGNFDASQIDELKGYFLKHGALNKSRSNDPVPLAKRLKKLNQTKRNSQKSNDYLKDFYSSMK